MENSQHNELVFSCSVHLNNAREAPDQMKWHNFNSILIPYFGKTVLQYIVQNNEKIIGHSAHLNNCCLGQLSGIWQCLPIRFKGNFM